MTTTSEIHPVDQMLPTPRLLALGLQHVLVMYAGAVAVPLIIGRALKLPPEDVAFLISADLFACGLATLVQCIGFPGVGIRLPVMMGVTFASVGPMLSMAAAPDIGLLGIYGSVIAAGIFGITCRAFHQPSAAAVSARRHRHHHPGDRNLVDAGRYQLGRRRSADPDQGDGRGSRRLSQSRLWPVAGTGNRAVRAAGDPRPDQMGLRLRRQCFGAARHRRGCSARQRARRDAFRQGRFGALGRDRHPVPFRHAAISSGADHHHVHRDDRGDDRIARHVPRARRDHRQEDRPRRADSWSARRRRRYAAWRHLQYVPLHIVLAECRPCQRHRRALALGHDRRRRHHAAARLACRRWRRWSKPFRSSYSAAPAS